jgi:type I restriction enzyme, S subunit
VSHYKPYPEYRDSGVEWIGDVPEHWDVKRLRQVASFANSGIDKKSYEGQETVSLCNYTDVYYNEFITADMPFMRATASKDEIEHFTLRKGDLIITKDSEDPSDIGIPALLIEDAPGVVCGYHLTLIRSVRLATARLLHRVLQSTPTRAYFFIESPGITRYGLGQDVIGDLRVCMPPASEITRIADRIDRETKRIDSLIAKKTRFIELLKEKRQALITHVVTKGLDPNVKMRDSGVEWIGDVPEHWGVKSIGYVLDAVGDVDHFMPVSVEKGVPYLMTGDLKELVSRVNMEDCKQISHSDYAKISKRIKSSKGDVIVARYATIGTSMYVDIDIDFLVSYSCVTIKTTPSKVSGWYLFQYLKSDAFYQGISNQTNTNTQGNVGINDLKKVKMALPSLSEQSRIIEYLNSKLKNIDSLTEKTKHSIDLLKERRSAFITAAVTGQIDLRESA